MEVNAQGFHEWEVPKWATDTYRLDPIHLARMCIAIKDIEHTSHSHF